MSGNFLTTCSKHTSSSAFGYEAFNTSSFVMFVIAFWFDPQLGQYSFRGLMIVILTEFIPLSPLSVVSTMVMWESSQWLGKNIVWSTG